MRRWSVLAALLLAGCGILGGGETPPPTEPETQADDAATPAPPTETPVPSRSEMILCAAGPPPAVIYGSPDPLAGAIQHLVAPPPAVYGEDYLADPRLLADLPSFEDGTIVRNDDGTLTIQLTYRDDLTWSDGEPLTTEDILLGLSLPTPEFASAVDVLEARVDGETIVITAGPQSEYPYVPVQPPLPSHIMDVAPDDIPLDVGIGPYTLTSESPNEWVFSANPNYPASLIPTLSLRLLADGNQAFAELGLGNCDLLLDGSLGRFQTSILDSTDVALAIWDGSAYERLIFNSFPTDERAPILADAQVRQALASAVNRSFLTTALTGGITRPLDSWLPDTHWAYVDALTVDFDQAVAEQLLTDAGWVDTDGDGVREAQGSSGTYACQRGDWSIEPGTPLELDLVVPLGDLLREQESNLIINDLSDIGVRVQLTPVDPSLLFAPDGRLAQRDFDMVLLSAVIRPDPNGIERFVGADVFRHPTELNLVHRWQLEDRWLQSEQLVERVALNNIPTPANDFQGQNFSGWCQDEANLAIAAANTLNTVEERAPFYAEQQAIYGEQVPSLPLFALPRVAAHVTELCGIAPGPVDPLTWNIDAWTFVEDGPCP
ncbi:MAG: ABC transporter substrate-binding protein [Anaerolineae bacterium]